MASKANWPYVINMGNSIIGVTVLAMPFCFRQVSVIIPRLKLFMTDKSDCPMALISHGLWFLVKNNFIYVT